MNNKAKALLTFGGVVAAIVVLVKSTEESDEEYYTRELAAVNTRLEEVNHRWTHDHLSLNQAVHLKKEEEDLLKRKFEVEAKLNK